jgi:hypothetical protein
MITRWRFAFAWAFWTAAIMPPVFAAERDIELFNSLVPRSLRLPEGRGLLIVTVESVRGRRSREPMRGEVSLDFAQADQTSTSTVTVRSGGSALLELDSGRYCLRAVRAGGREHKLDCAPPFVDVHAHSVDFTGNLRLTLRGYGATVERDVVGLQPLAPLDEEQTSRVRSALQAGEVDGVRTLFVSSPVRPAEVIRLYSDGSGRSATYTVTSPTYQPAPWASDGAGKLVIRDKYRLQREGSEWMAHATWVSRSDPRLPAVRGHRILAVSNDPLCWHWTRCGTRIPSGLVSPPDYTWVRARDRLQGRLDIQFGIEAHGSIAKPTAISVRSSTLPADVLAQVKEQLPDMRFTPDLVSNSTRYAMDIEYRLDAGELDARHGAVRAVTQAKSPEP